MRNGSFVMSLVLSPWSVMDRRTKGMAMPRRYLFVALLLLLEAALPGVRQASAQSGTTAFVGVSVLPMDREQILEDYTVVVSGGVIRTVAPAHRVQVPAGARVIPGEGLFLAPALGDMHVRLPGAERPPEEVDDFMFLYLANGITTLRGMDGAPSQLRLKASIASGEILGPTLYVGSPPLEGEDARDPERAVARMLANRSAGYDLQTIDSDVSPAAWDSLAEEAHSRGYTFGGTIPDSVGLRHALSSGMSTIEHLDGYLDEVASDAVQARIRRGENVPLRQVLESAEGRKMRAMAAHTRSSDTWIVPMLYLWGNRYLLPDPDSMLALPEMRYVPADLRVYWAGQEAALPSVDPETGALMVEVRRRMLRALTMAGVGVLMGTGAPEMFDVPGFSLRHELHSMEEAGLTPYEILVTGTRSVAKYARDELLEAGNFGTVAEGNRADLLLLRRNPFEDLQALWDQEGVMVRGRWISREEIDQRLEGMAERYGEGERPCP